MSHQSTKQIESLYRTGDRVRFYDPVTGYQRGCITSIDLEKSNAVIEAEGTNGGEFTAPLAQLF